MHDFAAYSDAVTAPVRPAGQISLPTQPRLLHSQAPVPSASSSQRSLVGWQWRPATPGSVLISHGRIVDAGHIDALEDADVIDVRVLAIAPGFIDMHSHSDLKVLENRTEKSHQGITTEVVGNCGFSPYPCGNHAALLAEQNEGILNGGSSWTNAGAYLADVRGSSRLVQVESLIGHGALRTAVYGADAASPTLTRLAQMEF